MKFIKLLLFILTITLTSNAQAPNKSASEARADALRGTLTDIRINYDIHYYHLDAEIDLEQKSISGSNEFHFTVVEDLSKLQFDLFKNMLIKSVLYKGRQISFTREANAVFLTFPIPLKKGSKEVFTVIYEGTPLQAITPPWDGGFVFSKDDSGNPFVSVATQGLGASSWWPNKDHQSDEVDSMSISITVPKELDEVSNGRLRNVEDLANGKKKYNWFVSEPINNYNVSFYIGKYANWKETYAGQNGPLTLDYWALKNDSLNAKAHWSLNTTKMLRAFEYWFGPYPWYKDGFKLVQAPYLGMEHQSAIAYGNQFKNGYLGTDLSDTGHGLKWDFIVIHEAGHEWWGNSITTKDIADMWVHEGFTTYSEVLFTEFYYGPKAASEYIIGLRKNIENKSPLIGKYGLNTSGSPDMYSKGANLIHTIRTILSNDVKFRKILIGLNETFAKKTVNTSDIESYISKQSGFDFSKVFDQYLRHSRLPVFEYRINDNLLTYRWNSEVSQFNMPMKIQIGTTTQYRFLPTTTEWQTINLDWTFGMETLKFDPNLYIEVKKVN